MTLEKTLEEFYMGNAKFDRYECTECDKETFARSRGDDPERCPFGCDPDA